MTVVPVHQLSPKEQRRLLHQPIAAVLDEFPRMPVAPKVARDHNSKIPDCEPAFNVCVARPVHKSEISTSAGAQAALKKEWDRLRNAGCWDEKRVREWGSVSSDARKADEKAHVGRIFEICVEKGSELSLGNPERKFKGRVVFQGNNVHA